MLLCQLRPAKVNYMFHSLRKLFSFKIKKFGLEKKIAESEIVKRWDRIIADSLGAKYNKKSKPLFIKHKTLFVDCLDSVWTAEFQANAWLVLEKIQNKFGEKIVEKIRFIS